MEKSKQRALDAYEASLPVRLMETPRDEFSTCMLGEPFASVQLRNKSSSFDFIPVLNDGTQTIVGVLSMNDSYQQGDLVRDRCTPIHENFLIGANVSILDFVRKADEQPFCFVIDGHRIGGLVCLSDLQQLPVRAALFAMVTQLEMTMADVIANSFEGDSWSMYLSERRRGHLDHMLQQAITEKNQVDPLLYTQFCDKADIVRKHCDPARWGVRRADCERDFSDIQKLRNHLAHGNDFATSPTAARGVCALVRTMDHWLDRLDATLASVRRSIVDNG